MSWACAVCTFVNHESIPLCEMCETDRPLTPSVAASASFSVAPRSNALQELPAYGRTHPDTRAFLLGVEQLRQCPSLRLRRVCSYARNCIRARNSSCYPASRLPFRFIDVFLLIQVTVFSGTHLNGFSLTYADAVTGAFIEAPRYPRHIITRLSSAYT